MELVGSATPLAADALLGETKNKLSLRQFLILQKLKQGKSNSQIAAELNISHTKVKSHVSAILRIFCVSSRLEVIVQGYEPLSQLPPKNNASTEQSDTNLAESFAQLTGRQRAVLTTLLRGKRNKQIASELSISETTVKTHMKALMNRLDAHSRIKIAILLKNSNCILN